MKPYNISRCDVVVVLEKIRDRGVPAIATADYLNYSILPVRGGYFRKRHEPITKKT